MCLLLKRFIEQQKTGSESLVQEPVVQKSFRNYLR